mmetsp:Transcript_11869/g.14130  ORF Transcript_11869/g.14130 Transcript_11869/m.14130 type:complete len:84 (-) Transcript_11869:23-274(-)
MGRCGHQKILMRNIGQHEKLRERQFQKSRAASIWSDISLYHERRCGSAGHKLYICSMNNTFVSSIVQNTVLVVSTVHRCRVFR